MNHNQAMNSLKQDVVPMLSDLEESWKVLFDDKAIQTAKIRAMYVIKSCITRQNASLTLINELMQLEAQTASTMSLG